MGEGDYGDGNERAGVDAGLRFSPRNRDEMGRDPDDTSDYRAFRKYYIVFVRHPLRLITFSHLIHHNISISPIQWLNQRNYTPSASPFRD